MAFLKGSDKHKSSSAERSESSNTPEPSKIPSYFSSITNTGTRGVDGYQRTPRPFTPHQVVPSATNSIIHPTDETPIQQTPNENYSPPHVPPEAPSLTERNDITDTEWSRGCQVAVNSEESPERGPVAEEEKSLPTPQQARLGMSLEVHNGGASRPLEIPDPSEGMAAGQVEGEPHNHIGGEDPTGQRIQVSNANIKRDVSEYHA